MTKSTSRLILVEKSPEDKEYQINFDEEYLFYSNPVSEAGSWIDLTGENAKKDLKGSIPALHDPVVRRQLAKQKVYLPWFLGVLTVVQIAVMIAELVLNSQNTGSAIETNPFNYMIGPSSGVIFYLFRR